MAQAAFATGELQPEPAVIVESVPAVEPVVLAPVEAAPQETDATVSDEEIAAAVGRSAFAMEIVDREPVDSVIEVTNDQTKIFYFTELLNLDGTTVTHRWSYDGNVIAEIPFEVGGSRWRVYSSKTLDPAWLGDWTVTVLDQDGQVLAEQALAYTDSAAVGSNPEPIKATSPAAPGEDE